MKTIAMVTLICAFLTLPAGADMVYWTDWTSAGSGTASGTIDLPISSDISITYTGDLNPAAQLGAATDINYWIPSSPYTSATVDNAPSTTDIIRTTSAGVTRTVTFSQPVENPIMAIVSQGRSSQAYHVRYYFDTPFDVLSYGPGYWNGPGTLTEEAGNVLLGVEGHGTIQFLGTISSFSWTSSPEEYWHGFTIGALEPVPVPGAMLLGLLGLGAAGAKLRRRA